MFGYGQVAQLKLLRHCLAPKFHEASRLGKDCDLSASAAVKVSAIQNAKNVARKVVKMFKIGTKKAALLKSCIKEDASSQRETKRYLVGLCETRFVKLHVSISVKHSKLVAKNFNKVCPKSAQNAVKLPLLYVNFQKISGGAFPRTSEASFCSSTCFELILPKKTTYKIMLKFGVPSLKKFLITPQHETFTKGLFTLFPRLHLYRFCIYSSKHSSQFKIAPPPKFSGSTASLK